VVDAGGALLFAFRGAWPGVIHAIHLMTAERIWRGAVDVQLSPCGKEKPQLQVLKLRCEK